MIREICSPEKCTGCCSCLNICPTNCITMKNNEIGEIHPVINHDNCIGCNKCILSCPNNINLTFHVPEKVFANWITDVDKRKICASGGIATIMSEYVIKSGGIVYGTRYDEELNPICKRVTDINELEKLKGSKYVQSYVGDTYKLVKKDLKQGLLVLYIGTPCQIAGLIAFLKNMKTDNLITCDLICHGVSPMSYFKDEIEHLKIKGKIKEITDCRFRGNDGKNFRLTLWNGNSLEYNKPAYSQYYFSGFLKAVSLRESCYTCDYAQPKRIADITIGDFIGLGKKIPFNYINKNISVTILNSRKGLDFWEKIEKESANLMCEERDYSEAIDGGPSLRAPFPYHEYTRKFRELYQHTGWVIAIRTVLKKDIRKNQIRTYFSYAYRIPRKAIKIFFYLLKVK